MKLNTSRTSEQAKAAKEFLAWVETNAPAITARANDDGYTGFGPGGSGRHSGISDPTASAATGIRDRRAELAASQFRDHLYQAHRHAEKAERIGRGLLALPTSTEEERKYVRQLLADTGREVGTGPCVVCGHVCEGVIVVDGVKREDRRRSGRCENCRKYRERNGEDRPRALWEAAV